MNTKIVWVVSTAVLLVACGGNTQRRRAVKNGESMESADITAAEIAVVAEVHEAEEVIDPAEEEGIDWSASIPVSRPEWMELPSSAYAGKVPSAAKTRQWTRAFEGAFSATEVSAVELHYFNNTPHFFLVNDLINTLFRSGQVSDDEKTYWRLQQYRAQLGMPTGTNMEDLKALIEDTLDYVGEGSPLSYALQMSLKGALWSFYRRQWVDRLDLSTREPLRSAIRKEVRAWLDYCTAFGNAYHYLCDYPDQENGAATIATSAKMDAINGQIGMHAMENGYAFLLGSNAVYGYGSRKEVTADMIRQEYARFAEVQEEHEWAYSVSVRRRSLQEERKAWEAWMLARATVSDLLEDTQKQVFEEATKLARREKLVMLKNRYGEDDFGSSSVQDLLLQYDCSDAELFGPSFEEKLAIFLAK